MLKLLGSTLGYYLPSFLYIYTEKPIDFENFEANPLETKGTFMHEYCHYHQDISTTYGYNNFVCILQEVIQKNSPRDKDNEQILNENRNMYGLCNGDKNVDDMVFFINGIKLEKGDELFEYVIVRYNGDKEFQFGNLCIAESMAYLVERRLYKTKERNALRGTPYSAPKDSTSAITIKVVDKKQKKILRRCDFAIIYYEDCGRNDGYYYLRNNKKQNVYAFVFRSINSGIQEKVDDILGEDGGWAYISEEYRKLKDINEGNEKHSYSFYAEAVNNVYNQMFYQ